MSKTKPEDAAFPAAGPAGIHTYGMSLRDFFASSAIPGVLQTCKGDTMLGQTQEQYFAAKAYAIADAMIAARGE